MKVFLKHFSYRTFLNFKDLFQSIFPVTEIACKFAWSKILYINFGLAPCFKEELVYDIRNFPIQSILCDKNMTKILRMEQMANGPPHKLLV